MLALILAVVSLSSIDPDPIVTPAPVIHDRITSAGFAPGASTSPAGFTSDITVSPACTFGVPQFGNSFWNDAASLARMSQPECAGMATSGSWLPAFGSAPVWLESAPRHSAMTGSTTRTYTAPLPARFTALSPVSSHLGSEPVVRTRAGAEPIFARGPAGAPPHTAERRH